MTRYSAIALFLLAASSAHAAEKTLERTFTVSPGGSLVVDADSASVQVSGGATNQVTVRMSAHGSDEDLATMTLDAFQKGDGVTVTMRRRGKEAGLTGEFLEWRCAYRGHGAPALWDQHSHRRRKRGADRAPPAPRRCALLVATSSQRM